MNHQKLQFKVGDKVEIRGKKVAVLSLPLESVKMSVTNSSASTRESTSEPNLLSG